MEEEKLKEEIKNVMTALGDSFDKELFEKSEDELESYWHFKYDATQPLETNLYLFFDSLELYKSFCERWEEKKNGHCCIVERVHDKYLMPKISEFVECIVT